LACSPVSGALSENFDVDSGRWRVVRVVSLGYRTDLALLRLGGTEIEDRGDHLLVRSPHNPDFWWGNFLLLAEVPAPERSSEWLDRFAESFPQARHAAIGFDGTDGSVRDLAGFAAHGLAAEAATVMTATKVHKPSQPNSDAAYRLLGSDDDWEQSIELRVRCNDRDIDAAAYLAFATAKVQTNRQLVDAGRGGWFGAFVDGRLVSQMGLFTAGRGLARFQSVETDPQYRRRGLAGSLVYYVSRYGFDTMAADTLVMVADPNYFAIDLYRAVGFAATETQLQVERSPTVS
jgi:ribosomal protein S18 acetylase RimI-like enzyme